MSDNVTATPAAAPPAAPPAAQTSIPWFALAAVLLGTFISTLNGRLSTFGLADIRGGIHAGFDEGAWITTAQTVAQMLICPFALWAGANFGPKPVLRYAALAFAVINLITPFYTDLSAFLVLRFAGGVASGFFIPLTLGFILTNTPPRVWAYGIAMYALNLELSLNISASIEGWFIDHLSWRWIFWQNVPLGLGMALCLRFSGPAPPPRHMHADIFGMVTAGIGFSLIYAALDQGNRVDWLNSGLVCGLLAAGFVLLVAFFIHDARTPYPLINLKVAFVKPLPSMLVLVSFLRLTILATAFLVPQYLQVVRGFRSLEVGQTLLWLAAPQLIICPLAGLLLRRFDPRIIASVGFLLISLSCYLIAHELTPLWGSDQFLVSAVLQAVGQSFALSGSVFYGIQYIRPQDALTFGTMLQIARLMGGEVGQAFVTTFERIRAQIASNLIGLHVQIGDAMTDQRIQAYAGATRAAGDPSSGPARGAFLLGSAVRSAATVQGVIDTFEALAAMALLALILLIAQRAAPIGPSTHRSLLAPRQGVSPR